MDLRQLETLVAVADHGSFSAAARSMYTVQSNVSAHIGRLERELGVTLVDRQRGGLTDEGATVVDRARRVLHDLQEIAAEMASRGDDVHGDTRVGMIGTMARWVVPTLLAQLRDLHPGVHPMVYEGNTSTLVPRLLSGHLDAAVVHLPLDEPDLHVTPLFAEDLLLLVPASHALATSTEASLTDLAGQPLILPPAGTAFRRVLDRAANLAGVELVPLAEIDGVRLMAALAFEGLGATIVPATAIPRVTGDHVRVAMPGLPRRVVAWVQRKRPSPGIPTRTALTVLREIVAINGESQPGVHVGPEAFPLSRTAG